MSNKPNLFEQATSELTQDAFIKWLLDWANPDFYNLDCELCKTAQNFVRLLLNNDTLHITSIECKKQEHHIDVFAIVNNKYVLVIEDKTNTNEHSNQISRYLKWAEEKYKNLELHGVYYKSGNESKHKLDNLKSRYTEYFPNASFNIISKENVLGILRETKSTNAILIDYINHIQLLQEKTNSYKDFSYKD